MAYKTSRTRTVTCEPEFNTPVTMILTVDADVDGVASVSPILSASFATMFIEARAYTDYHKGDAGGEWAPGDPRPDTGGYYHYGTKYTARILGYADVVTFSEVGVSGYVPRGSYVTVSFDIALKGSMEVNLATEWVDFTGITVSSDGKFTHKATLDERITTSDTLTASIGTASNSHHPTFGFTLAYPMSSSNFLAVRNTTATSTIVCTMNGESASDMNEKHAASGFGYSIVLIGNTGSSVTCTSSDPTVEAVGQIDATHYVPRIANYDGIIRSFGDPYPATVAAIVYGDPAYPFGHVVSAGAVWSTTVTQKRWSAQFSAQSALIATATLDEWKPTSCKLQAAGLLGAGENGLADEAPIHGFVWTIGALSQSATLQVAGTFSRTDSTAYGLPDGSTAAGAKGSHASFWGASVVSMDGYQYLSIPLKHDAGGTESLSRIGIPTPSGTKWFSHDRDGNALSKGTGGAYTTFYVDLCNPDGIETSDSQDSKFPYLRTDSWAWGITQATGIILDGITPGVTWTAQKAELSRRDKSLVTVLPTFANMVAQDGLSGDPILFRSDFLQAWTAGKKSLEQSDVLGQFGVWNSQSIAQIRIRVNGNSGEFPSNGWSMTSNAAAGATDTLAYYLSEDREGWCLCGSGAVYSGGWSYAIDQDASSSYAITGQTLHTEITSWFPGIGDVFALGSYGGGIKLRPASFLRGQAAGTTETTANGEAASVPVRINSGTYGSGTSNSFGVYETGTPYATPGSRTVRAEIGTTPYPEIAITVIERKRHRVCFRVVPATPAVIEPFNLHDDYGAYYRVGVGTSGKVLLYRSNFPTPRPSWSIAGVEVTTETNCHRPTLHFDTLGRLWCVYESGGNAMARVSDDDGASFGDPVTMISGGLKPFGAKDGLGNRLVGALVLSAGDYVLHARYRAAGETAFGADFICQYNNGGVLADLKCENDTFSFSASEDMQGRWLLSCVPKGDTDSRDFESFDIGQAMTWGMIT